MASLAAGANNDHSTKYDSPAILSAVAGPAAGVNDDRSTRYDSPATSTTPGFQVRLVCLCPY
jgi:hypothetical protein